MIYDVDQIQLFLESIQRLEIRQQIQNLHCQALASSQDGKAIKKAIAKLEKELGQ